MADEKKSESKDKKPEGMKARPWPGAATYVYRSKDPSDCVLVQSESEYLEALKGGAKDSPEAWK